MAKAHIWERNNLCADINISWNLYSYAFLALDLTSFISVFFQREAVDSKDDMRKFNPQKKPGDQMQSNRNKTNFHF